MKVVTLKKLAELFLDNSLTLGDVEDIVPDRQQSDFLYLVLIVAAQRLEAVSG